MYFVQNLEQPITINSNHFKNILAGIKQLIWFTGGRDATRRRYVCWRKARKMRMSSRKCERHLNQFLPQMQAIKKICKNALFVASFWEHRKAENEFDVGKQNVGARGSNISAIPLFQRLKKLNPIKNSVLEYIIKLPRAIQSVLETVQAFSRPKPCVSISNAYFAPFFYIQQAH